MSQENVEIVRQSIEATNAFMSGELSSKAYAETFDPQIEVLWHERAYPDFPGHLRGIAACIAFSEQYRDGWDDLTAEPLELFDAPGGRVLVLVRQSGRGPQSGVPIVIHFFELVTIREGKLRQVEYFRHRAEALEAAGLSE
jgi:hypothetical protein